MSKEGKPTAREPSLWGPPERLRWVWVRASDWLGPSEDQLPGSVFDRLPDGVIDGDQQGSTWMEYRTYDAAVAALDAARRGASLP